MAPRMCRSALAGPEPHKLMQLLQKVKANLIAQFQRLSRTQQKFQSMWGSGQDKPVSLAPMSGGGVTAASTAPSVCSSVTWGWFCLLHGAEEGSGAGC